MRTSTARLALAAAGLAVVGLVGGAQAASKPTVLVITDDAGDSLGQPGDDIVKVTYSTTGTTSKVGKKTVYTPKALTVTLEAASNIATDGVLTYEVDADLAGCDAGFDLYFTPGVEGSEGGGCVNQSGTTDFESVGVDGPPVISGKTMTFTVALSASPAFKVGSSISGIRAFTGAVDPVVGFVGPYIIDSALANDDVTSEATYKIG